MHEFRKYLLFDFIKNFIFTFTGIALFIVVLGIMLFLFATINIHLEKIVNLFIVSLIISSCITGIKIYTFLKIDKNNEFYNVSIHTTIQTDSNKIFHEIKDYCQSRKWYIFKEDKEALIIKCFTNFSFWSNGEIVKIKLNASDNKSIIVEISSKHIFPFTFMDFGKRNLKNIHSIEESLKEYKLTLT